MRRPENTREVTGDDEYSVHTVVVVSLWDMERRGLAILAQWSERVIV